MKNNSTLIKSRGQERWFSVSRGTRKMVLSEQIDVKFEDKRAEESRAAELAREELADAAGGFDEQDWNESGPSGTSENVDIDIGSLDQSKNRSGLVRQSKCLVNNSTQTESEKSYTTPIRKNRNFEPKIKAAIATSSAKARITVEQARRAFQASSEIFYNEKYYLSVDDVQEASTDPTYKNLKCP